MAELENQRVEFLDVGHGDSSVIYLHDFDSEEKKVIIIDVANTDKLLKELDANGIKVIELIVISHFDADHCRGLNDFLEKFVLEGTVKRICYNLDRRSPTKIMRLILKKFLENYKKYRIGFVSGKVDDSMPRKSLVSCGRGKLYLLYPDVTEEIDAYLRNNTNDNSIVCFLESDVCRILFSGDLEERGWRMLLERIPALKCDVLKMPHHGAFYDGKDGMGLRDILKILEPRDAIISSGHNSMYNHPDTETVKLLKEKGINIYCTEFTGLCHDDIDEFERKCCGDTEVIIGERAYKIKTEARNLGCLNHAAC